MKIKIKYFTDKIDKLDYIDEKSDWIDLRAAKDISLSKGGFYLIPLGVAMEIPEGFKANLYPRSSTYKKWKIIFANSVGNIDSSYSGNDDEWKASVIALGNTTIEVGDKIAQFEIVPSSKATFWQKLKWLFSSKIEFVEVECLEHHNRGGFGTSGSR